MLWGNQNTLSIKMDYLDGLCGRVPVRMAKEFWGNQNSRESIVEGVIMRGNSVFWGNQNTLRVNSE